MAAVAEYLRAIRRTHEADPTEHSYRPALQALLEALRPGAVVTNEPQHSRRFGAVDMRVSTGAGPEALTIGYVECKDIGAALDEVEKTEQLKRYRDNLPSLVLTDYLEFRWYVDGERRATARLAHVDSTGRIVTESGGPAAVEALLTSFLQHAPEPIRDPEDLARRMAHLTRQIADIVRRQLASGDHPGEAAQLHHAFQETLLPNIEADEFADMYAQTLAYGLFAARVNHRPGAPFTRRDAAADIPKTNPFLRRLFDAITGVALDDEPYVGYVDDLTRLLAHADMGAILADFGARTRRDDPIVHFYETFLAAYDPKLREMRGVYYTPEPVVSYIVRSVDWILREHFGLSEGLADRATVEYEVRLPGGGTETRTSPRVLILDPACGTGTFLYHVIDHIRQQFVQSNNAGMWPGFVREHLLPRLFGFELLMAPYAVAHLKLGMQLAAQDMTEEQRAKWAYDFAPDERLGIYLTNTLEEAESVAQVRLPLMQTIVEEANAAAEVKRDLPIMVIIGNPPYSGHSANKGKWIDGLLKGRLPDGTRVDSYYEVDGEPLGEKNPKWLQDDYVKFIRWAQWRIEQTGAGVLAFITNHGYLDNPTFRGMRESLLSAFTDIYVLNLHGNTLKKEISPDGSADENVFDIMAGVAITILVRMPGGEDPASLHYCDLWGARRAKSARLQRESAEDLARGHELRPAPPLYLFVPCDSAMQAEYQAELRLPDIMLLNGVGMTTARDAFAVAYERHVLLQRVRALATRQESDDFIHDLLHIPRKAGYELSAARQALRRLESLDDMVHPVLYRPFDERRIFYHEAVVWRTARRVMENMLRGPNIGLIATRQTRDPWDVLVTDRIITHKALAAYDINSLFPLYLYPDPEKLDDLGDSPWPEGPEGRRPNLSKDFVEEFAGRLGMRFVPDGRGDLRASFGPEDIFDYIYAVFHAPTYRERYAEFLKIDFPRVPLTSDPALFRDLVALGGRLVALHLMEAPELDTPMTSFPEPGDNLVEKGHPKYVPPGEVPPGEAEPTARGRVYINRTKRRPDAPPAQYFDGVPPEVWEFQVGGYQVLDKWLKDRRGRRLTDEDLRHYQRVVVALARTIEIMATIDARIEEWPIR